MTDKKRLIGEDARPISQGEIDAWNRGRKDAQRNERLKSKVSADLAIRVVRAFAQSGKVQDVSLRLDIPVDAVRRVLNAFEISSIEDARESISSGVIGELDAAVAKQQDEDGAQTLVDYEAASQRLADQQAALAGEERTVEEMDKNMAERRDEAQRRNKADRLRQMIADGIDVKTGKTTFRIPLSQVKAFKAMIPRGVETMRRQFGGTAKDIVSEVKRLVPDFDTDMLRP